MVMAATSTATRACRDSRATQSGVGKLCSACGSRHHQHLVGRQQLAGGAKWLAAHQGELIVHTNATSSGMAARR
jgi:hypothetical protein